MYKSDYEIKKELCEIGRRILFTDFFSQSQKYDVVEQSGFCGRPLIDV